MILLFSTHSSSAKENEANLRTSFFYGEIAANKFLSNIEMNCCYFWLYFYSQAKTDGQKRITTTFLTTTNIFNNYNMNDL